jgi:DNA-directed RNA polymerase specialized sigma24 family protein
MNDRELLQAYKAGDGYAFTDFFNRHVNDVTRWVAANWKLPLSDVDVAVQSAFVSISRRAEIPDNPRVYLEQAALQQAKLIKARKKKHSDRFGSVHEIAFDGVSIAGDRQSAQFIAPEPLKEHPLDGFNRAIDQAIDRLAPKEREVLCELRKTNNISRAAKTLDIDWATAKKRRDRAIANLKPLLA